MTTFNKDQMLARYWEVRNAMDAVRAKVAPLREARDKAVNEAAAADKKAMAEIRKIEDAVLGGIGMHAAQNELAFLARGLGNVGDNPAGKKAA